MGERRSIGAPGAQVIVISPSLGRRMTVWTLPLPYEVEPMTTAR